MRRTLRSLLTVLAGLAGACAAAASAPLPQSQGEPQSGPPQTGQFQTGQSQTGQSQTGQSQTGQSQPGQPETGQPPLHVPGRPYRTPRSGQGFSTRVFGMDVDVPPRDRRSVTAWDLGVDVTPELNGSDFTPFGSIYVWRRPDDDTLLRATLLGLYDDVHFSTSPRGSGDFELIATFENLTPPVARADYVDGRKREDEELLWGYVRGGIGAGIRKPVAPWHQDNMFAVGLTVHPGYYFFSDGSDTAPGFVVPQDTWETRVRLQLRWDAFERNLLELPHTGFALGGDLLAGFRHDWEDWGFAGGESARETRNWTHASGYLVTASGVPFVDSDRHRLLFYLHAGTGDDVDRFSTPRLGGGPQGEDYGAIPRAVLPGAAIEEFLPRRYVVGIAEYRFEPIFFFYTSLRGSLARLDRERLRGVMVRHETDTFASLGVRLTSGFVGETRIQIDWNYAFDVIRDGDRGGHEIMVHVSRSF